jgi:hypothetical protein
MTFFVRSLRFPKTCAALMALASCASGAWAQDGSSEFSSAPCSSVKLGPTDEISHLQRIYLFKKAAQTIQYKFFADDKCTRPLYSFVFKGQVEMGPPVADVPGAAQAKLSFERILFTLDSPRGAKAAAQCGDGNFEVGVQRDVSDAKCLFMPSVKSCGVDFDIVKLKDGVITPGLRTADMCSAAGRPVQLQGAGAQFVEKF